MRAKDTVLLNTTITQHPILARRAWFWHVASHLPTSTQSTCPPISQLLQSCNLRENLDINQQILTLDCFK